MSSKRSSLIGSSPVPYTPEAMQEEREKLHTALGRAIGAWSQLEHAFSAAFAHVLGINETTAAAVFFSAKSFTAKHDMLLAAIKASGPFEGVSQKAVFKSACGKARKWTATRNSLAHDRLAVTVMNNHILAGLVFPNYLSENASSQSDNWLTRHAIDQSAMVSRPL